jgi:DNA repair exonuclease SbcCD ATPase subunit
MLKKALVVVGGAVLLLGLFFGRDAFSYVSTGWGQMHQAVHDSVPIKFQIDRARKMIKDLDPEIRRNMQLIAKEEVEVDKLTRQVDKAEKDLVRSREEIQRLNADLKRGDSNFVYAGRTYSEKQVKSDLENRFTRYQTSEATAEKLDKILAARQKGLIAAREKLEAMLSAKRQLEVEVENLEARLKMVEVAQTTSDFNFDDSRLSRTKELITDIQTRIDVAEKMVGAEGTFHDEIPLSVETEDDSSDITERVTRYFEESTTPTAEVATK